MSNFNPQFARQALATINKTLTDHGLPKYATKVSMSEIKAQYDKDVELTTAQALTGADATTGQGLINVNVDPRLRYLMPAGGVLMSNPAVEYRTNVNGSTVFSGLQTDDEFVEVECGVDNLPDAPNTTAPITVATKAYHMKLEACKTLLAQVTNPGQLIRQLEGYVNAKKVLLGDKIGVDAVLDAAIAGTISGVNVTNLEGDRGSIHQGALSMLGNMLDYGRGVNYFVNGAGFTKWVQESGKDGAYLTKKGMDLLARDGVTTPQAGLAGYFMGGRVYILPSIKSTYTTDANGTITASTGGNSTVMIAAVDKSIALIKGLAQFDEVRAFPQDYQKWAEDEYVIGARTQMGGGIILPEGVQYLTF